MTEKIIDLSQYRAELDQLKAEAEQVQEKTEREIILALVTWFAMKVDRWEAKREEYETTVADLEQSKALDAESEKRIMKDYMNHLKMVGRLLYIYHAIKIIKTEGEGWENDPTSMKGVLDHILHLWEVK